MKSKYVVNEDKRTVVCILTQCRYDLVNWVSNHTNYINIYDYTSDLLIENEFVGVAKCNPEDKFDDKIGKRIASIRAMRKYERARLYKLCEVFYSEANEALNLIDSQYHRFDNYPYHISVSDVVNNM